MYEDDLIDEDNEDVMPWMPVKNRRDEIPVWEQAVVMVSA